jgi:polyhydroxyalkanoate synthesis regulator phasin
MSKVRTARISQVGDSVRRLQEEADKVVGRVRNRLNDFARSPAKGLGDLVNEAGRVRRDLRASVRDAVQDAQTRLEKRVAEAVKPVAGYLDIASLKEMQDLRLRVAMLEKRVDDLSKSARAA